MSPEDEVARRTHRRLAAGAAVIHPIDALAAVMVRWGPPRLRVFPDGWGDLDAVALLGDNDLITGPPPAIEITWGRTKHLADRTERDGHFAAVTRLPEAAQIGSVRMIEPPGGEVSRLCLLMAAWNDHGFDTRQQLATELLRRDIASLLIEIPYYGHRRIVGNHEQPIPTVADFALMGLGAVQEGRALLNHFRNHYTVGVSGYSMGGNIGAMVGATAGFPVAMAPLAASHSPGPVFLDGVISNGIQWRALGGKQARDRLRTRLTAASVLQLPPPEWASSAVMVAARRDGFVPPSAVTALHQHWAGSELRWQSGGHATLLWHQRSILADAVADSFDRIERVLTA